MFITLNFTILPVDYLKKCVENIFCRVCHRWCWCWYHLQKNIIFHWYDDVSRAYTIASYFIHMDHITSHYQPQLTTNERESDDTCNTTATLATLFSSIMHVNFWTNVVVNYHTFKEKNEIKLHWGKKRFAGMQISITLSDLKFYSSVIVINNNNNDSVEAIAFIVTIITKIEIKTNNAT